MNEATMKEIAAIWDKLLEMDKKISSFIDMVHAASTAGIDENSTGILDVAELSDENNNSIIDIADQISSLDARVTALEGK